MTHTHTKSDQVYKYDKWYKIQKESPSVIPFIYIYIFENSHY